MTAPPTPAAIVSALAALIRSKYPDLNAANVINRIIRTARDAGPSGRDPQYGFGVIDPITALTANVPPVTANPLLDPAAARPTRARPVPAGADEEFDVTQHGDRGGPTDQQVMVIGIGIAVVLVLLLGLVVFLIWNRRRYRREAARAADIPDEVLDRAAQGAYPPPDAGYAPPPGYPAPARLRPSFRVCPAFRLRPALRATPLALRLRPAAGRGAARPAEGAVTGPDRGGRPVTSASPAGHRPSRRVIATLSTVRTRLSGRFDRPGCVPSRALRQDGRTRRYTRGAHDHQEASTRGRPGTGRPARPASGTPSAARCASPRTGTSPGPSSGRCAGPACRSPSPRASPRTRRSPTPAPPRPAWRARRSTWRSACRRRSTRRRCAPRWTPRSRRGWTSSTPSIADGRQPCRPDRGVALAHRAARGRPGGAARGGGRLPRRRGGAGRADDQAGPAHLRRPRGRDLASMCRCLRRRLPGRRPYRVRYSNWSCGRSPRPCGPMTSFPASAWWPTWSRRSRRG